jgi:AmiR/NasT family two-component response regulator
MPKKLQNLRVLVANEQQARVDQMATVLRELGHEVVARVNSVRDVGDITAREHPDVALVGVGESSEHALALITQIVKEAECPVIVHLHQADEAFVGEAARRGAFAYVLDGDSGSLRSALDIVLLRFGDYHGLEGAFGRRAIIERAKGVLMERHRIDDEAAFELLRQHSRQKNRKVVDTAGELLAGGLELRAGALAVRARPAPD